MQPITDDRAGETMPRDAHARQVSVPAVGGGIVGLEGAERRHDLVVLELATGNVDLAGVDAAGDTAARGWHRRPRAPDVLRHIVLLVHLGVARARDEGRAETAADGEDAAAKLRGE